MSSMLKKVMPAVVNIVNQGELTLIEDPFLRRELQQHKVYSLLENKHFISFGSGVIIDAKKGLIVTNAHVVDLDKKITVTLSDGRHFEAKKLGADNKTDIAVIQIQADNLTQILYGDSNKLNIGDCVVAIGSPFGLDQSVTSGVVSALHRSELGIEGYENFIQTDAPINVGNSGGALVNMQGQLVGINTALLSQDGGNIGIGFAIPSNMVKTIVTQIVKYGKVYRGLMGVMVQNLTPDLADAFGNPGQKGALVSQIIPGSPAQQAGIYIGDIITSINDTPITSSVDVHNIIGLLRVGETAKIVLSREDKIHTFEIKTIDPEKFGELEQKSAKPFLYGVQLENIEEQNPFHGYFHGVKVLAVDEYSAAFHGGLRPGDIIVSANHKPITRIQELNEMVKQNQEKLLLHVLRGKNTMFIVIK
jgi:serine protease Do